MDSLNVEEIVETTEGKLFSDSQYQRVSGICIDTRSIKPGDLFIPLMGETDGHRFIDEAIKSGAAGVLFESTYKEKEMLLKKLHGCFAVEVSNTLKAFQNIAKYYREKLGLKVVAITGSTGKTTTKDMINCVLAQKYRVVSTERNFNNEIGVPLTIFRADHNTEVLVVEMAMRGRGQIKELAEIAKPDIGVLTNIGQAHIELLGSEQAIAEAKAELIQSISESGVVVLNGDDLWTSFVLNCACARVVRYGITTGDVRAEKIEADALGRARFSLLMENGNPYTVRLPVPGRHNVYNALAASAVGLELGLTTDQIRIGLSNCRLSAMRMEVFTTSDKTVISCADADTAAQILKQLVEPGDVVLVKASRAIGLEAVVKAMVKI
ncbi:MAG: UDP-N-acetylmuramoyl-tripeptide--D-alanyl-D-alanine ligase [Rubrobacteridae bacterium]|nr:UDP-N-acetylmuramoyl-tripeptide--D-alanyl-D-alanine ligase [Rubrobacteridae bacterium]